MSDSKSNAAQARLVLRDAIRSGAYPRGSQLPSTRDLAEQFQINRNTAMKIYHELAEDKLVELVPNRPPVVVGDGTDAPEIVLERRIRDALWNLLHESQLIGLPPGRVTDMLTEAAYEFFADYRAPKIYIAECNDVEARAYAQELTLKLDNVVRPVLIEHLGRVVDADIVIAPFFHLQEVREKLGSRAKHVIGLVVTADSSDLAKVAAMVDKGPLGIVAVNIDAAERLRRLLGFQIDVPMMTGSTEHPETLDAMRDQVECIVCTVRAEKESWQRILGVPMALIRYQADDHSIEVLRGTIQRIGPMTESARGQATRRARHAVQD